MMNKDWETWVRPVSPACRMVAVIKPLFITTCRPRATATIMATETKSAIPPMKASMKTSSFMW